MRHLFKSLMFLIAVFAISVDARAAIEAHQFDNDVQRERYQSFIDEMRCPKCQNQNLAGSESPISADLRRELYEMIKAGKADKEIVDYMVSRYGDFILYRPRVTPVTYVLWITPVALLILGLVVLIVILRQRRRLAQLQISSMLTVDERARLDALLTLSDDIESSSNKKLPSDKNNKEPRS